MDEGFSNQDPTGGVASGEIEFAWPVYDNSWAEMRDDWDPEHADKLREENVRHLSRPMIEVLDDLGLEAEARSVGYGRGWEVEGIAVIVRSVVELASDLGGAVGFALSVRAAYRRLRRTKDADGNQLYTPTISLGTAKALALAHLDDHIGDLTEVRLIMAQVVAQVEHGHSGTDLFLIMFGRSDATWTYVIDSLGHLVGFAPGQPLHRWIGPVWGFDPEQLKEDLPTIADLEEE